MERLELSMSVRLLCLLLVCSVTIATDCPDRWVPFQGSCYFFDHGVPLTFVEAEHYCRQHHESHLVHIETTDENLFLKDYLGELKPRPFWIGLTDEAVEGIWVWYDTDTKATFTDWFPNEPSNGGDTGEDCGMMKPAYHYQWNDEQCDDKFEPICELSATEVPVVVG